MSPRSVADVAVDAEFGPRSWRVDRDRLAAYAAASGDHNPIHRDETAARAVGLPDVIAHGMWTMGAAAGLVADWAGDPTAVVAYRTKFTAPVVVPRHADVIVEARGRVVSVATDGPGTPSAVVELTVTCAGERVLNRARATVRLAAAEAGATAEAPTDA